MPKKKLKKRISPVIIAAAHTLQTTGDIPTLCMSKTPNLGRPQKLPPLNHFQIPTSLQVILSKNHLLQLNNELCKSNHKQSTGRSWKNHHHPNRFTHSYNHDRGSKRDMSVTIKSFL